MIDLDRYRWNGKSCDSSAVRPKPSGTKYEIPKHQRGERFVRGPIPCDWLQACIPLGLKALNVALALWWLVGMKRTNPVRLTSKVLRQFGVTAETGRTILSKMEKAGLVRVDHCRGRGPDVILLPFQEDRIPHVDANARAGIDATGTTFNSRER